MVDQVQVSTVTFQGGNRSDGGEVRWRDVVDAVIVSTYLLPKLAYKCLARFLIPSTNEPMLRARDPRPPIRMDRAGALNLDGEDRK